MALIFGAQVGFAEAPAKDDLPPAGHLLDEPATQAPAPGKADALPQTPDANVADDGLPKAGHLTDTAGQGQETGAARDPFAPLQLEVLINGYKIDLVAGFTKLADGNLASTRSELTAIGLKLPGKGKDADVVPLLSIPSLRYKFDELAQTIDISVAPTWRIPKHFDLIPQEDMTAATSDLGVVLNYSAFAAADTWLYDQKSQFSGASLNLDARAFSPYGVLQQTAALGTTTFSDFTGIRLNTTWTYSNQARAETYRLGDVVSGSLNWTRPVRLGGAELQRNFTLRPDLITTPLPSLTGTAEVPSTLDVYLNGMKSYTQDVPAGPYEVTRIPVITNGGVARVVLTDTSGRQTTSETPIYNSALLLGKGLIDYSVDLGFARRSYGTASFDYGAELMALASARYGITDFLTGEAHVEAKADLVDGGIGAVVQAGPFGTVNVAFAASDNAGTLGTFAYGAWDFQYGDFLAHLSSARTFGDFTDLAAATSLVTVAGLKSSSMPRAIDQGLLSYGFPDWQASVGLSLSHALMVDGTETAPLALNVTKSFGENLSVYGSAYIDIADTNNFGASVGLTMSIGKNRDISVAAEGAVDNLGYATQASVSKNMDSSYGSYGWRVAERENDGHSLDAYGSYRAKQAVFTGEVQSFNDKVEGKAAMEGSLVATKAGLFIGNPIADSFAVVKVGVPDMPVNYENRFVGKTGKDGSLLLTQVRSYRPSKVSIDATNLPLNSDVTETEQRMAPREMSGVVVDFGVKKQTSSALVIIKDASGAFLPAGTEITLADHKEPFIMGYDGQVYVTDLGAKNSMTAQLKDKACSVSFDYKLDDNAQTLIGPLTCS